MATYGKCVCGKRVSETKSGVPRAHICNAPDGPAWAVTVQPVVPADVDETDPFVSLNTADIATDEDCELEAGGHVHHFQYGDDGNGHSGSFCACGMEEPRGPYALIPEANWNGTGRPRPSASTVKMPEPAPQEDKPRLLDTIREARASVMGEVPMASAQEAVQANGDALRDAFEDAQAVAAAGMPGSAGQIMEDAFRKNMQFTEAQDAKGMAGHRDPLDDIGAFLSPSQSGIGSGDANDFLSAPEPQALGSATGQPETERDRYGRYLVKDPRTGDYARNGRGTPQGFTRATTYAKSLLDTYGLNQWEKRMVAVGMSLRPDLVQRAKGLDVTKDKGALEAIHEAAKEAAGGSEASSAGTEFHTVTEHLDAGLLTPDTVPEEWRGMARAYAEKMTAAGLTTRTEWIERITFTDRGGEAVTGTADRVLLERDGTPVIGDVKSGKGIDLAEREIAIQLLTYAMGVNQFGLYNKATKQWEPWTGPPVSEEYGIVMHVPVQRPNDRPPYCDLYRVSFRDVQGFDVARAMQAAAWTRRWRKAKGFATPYSPPAAPRQRTWAEAFSTVTTPEEANRLWEAAVAAGMGDADLASNVALARRALESQG